MNPMNRRSLVINKKESNEIHYGVPCVIEKESAGAVYDEGATFHVGETNPQIKQRKDHMVNNYSLHHQLTSA